MGISGPCQSNATCINQMGVALWPRAQQPSAPCAPHIYVILNQNQEVWLSHSSQSVQLSKNKIQALQPGIQITYARRHLTKVTLTYFSNYLFPQILYYKIPIASSEVPRDVFPARSQSIDLREPSAPLTTGICPPGLLSSGLPALPPLHLAPGFL